MKTFYERLLTDGSKYIGEINNGVPHGFGKLVQTNGNIYIGEFHEGIINGFGKTICQDHNLIGEHKDGYLNGIGILENLINKDESFNEPYGEFIIKDFLLGEFDNGKQNGIFCRNYRANDITVGEWEQITIGLFDSTDNNGVGLVRELYNQSSVLKCGIMSSNEMNMKELDGLGILVSSDDGIFTGEFKNDKLNGVGTIQKIKEFYSTGSNISSIETNILSGEFKNGKRQGIGIEKETIDYMDGIDRVKKIQVLNSKE